MDELSESSAFIHMLILKARAVMTKDGIVTPDPGGDAVDDPLPETLQDLPEDLTREELVEEIDALDEDRQAELVALMWLGRGDDDAEAWPDLLQLARERHETPDAAYLLSDPLVADYWAAGLDKLGYGSLLD